MREYGYSLIRENWVSENQYSSIFYTVIAEWFSSSSKNENWEWSYFASRHMARTKLKLDVWTSVHDICQTEFKIHTLAQILSCYHLLTFIFTLILLHVQKTGHLKDIFVFTTDTIKTHLFNWLKGVLVLRNKGHTILILQNILVHKR